MIIDKTMPALGHRDDIRAGASRGKIALFGLLPIVDTDGPDIAKSALARLLIESLALPAALLPGPHVAIGAVDAARFTATVSLHGETIPLTIAVDEEGRVRALSLPRWGDQTADGPAAATPSPAGCGRAGGSAPTGTAR